jgi:hypothetical protein
LLLEGYESIQIQCFDNRNVGSLCNSWAIYLHRHVGKYFWSVDDIQAPKDSL